MININKLNCGTITILSGKPGPVVHPETIVTYNDGSVSSFNIVGDIYGDSGEGIPTSQISNVTNAVEIDIGNTVTSIGSFAFSSCSRLTSVTIPDCVTSIGAGAFFGCGLTSVTIGNGVTSIGYSAFKYCSDLTSVTIPDSVTNIGGWAFYLCIGLTSVTFNSFTKNEVKSMTINDTIFGETFYDDEWNPIEKSFTVTCPNDPDESKSMTVHFSADEPATITFTDL